MVNPLPVPVQIRIRVIMSTTPVTPWLQMSFGLGDVQTILSANFPVVTVAEFVLMKQTIVSLCPVMFDHPLLSALIVTVPESGVKYMR
jgi:hypothetical protein